MWRGMWGGNGDINGRWTRGRGLGLGRRGCWGIVGLDGVGAPAWVGVVSVVPVGGVETGAVAGDVLSDVVSGGGGVGEGASIGEGAVGTVGVAGG